MFDGLQKKWKVSGLQVLLILCTFAIGGSLTGYAGRKLMPLFGIGPYWLWIIVYILLITILWPLAVLIVSVPFGQWRFFRSYLIKIGRRMGLGKAGGTSKLRIAIFASGAGSNAQKIIFHFRKHPRIEVALIVCNKAGAGVLEIAAAAGIPTLLIEKQKFFQGNGYVDELRERNIGLVVLAGFLWKLPPALVKAFAGRLINIHPALLPKYGGKGMYGHFVHEAVLAAGDKESGITIHFVDELYDHGAAIFQAACPVLETDTPQSLAQRIHSLEHAHYPRVVEEIADSLLKNRARTTA